MADEVIETPAENIAVEPETTAPASPVAEEQTAAPVETESAPVAEETTDTEHKPSRAERRIRQLAGEANELRQQSQLPQGQSVSPTEFDVMRFTDENGNVDVGAANQAANQGVVQAAQAIASATVQQQIAQDRAVQNVERDTEVLPTKYPELNPDSPDYSPELEQAIAEEFQEKAYRVVGYNPNGQPIHALDPAVRLSTVAERYMKVAHAAVTKSNANMRNAVATSADTNAVRPQGETKADRPFEELSIAEMEAKLGTVRR